MDFNFKVTPKKIGQSNTKVNIYHVVCPICGEDARLEPIINHVWECCECGMTFEVVYEDED